MSPSAKRSEHSTKLRWLWGVANMPSSLPSHADTADWVSGISKESSSKACWIDCRASAAEQGQVDEYPTVSPSSAWTPADVNWHRNGVFSEPQFNPQMVNNVFEDTSAYIGVIDPLGVGLTPDADLYDALLEQLANEITRCTDG